MLLKRILIVLLGIVIFRVGSFIPIPGINGTLLGEFFSKNTGTILDFVNAFSGGSLQRMSIFSTGIMPYISASIIIYIMSFILPSIKSLQQEGLNGQMKIAKYTRLLTLLIAGFQGFMLTTTLAHQIIHGQKIVAMADFDFYITAILSLIAGTMSLIWLGERITEFGIGNGVSLIIYAGVISRLPTAVAQTINLYTTGEITKLTIIGVIFAIVVATWFVVYVEKARREVSVEYSKKSFESLYSHKGKLPFKINMAGIMPPIFAASLMTIPATINTAAEKLNINMLSNITYYFHHGTIYYMIIYGIMITLFAHFLVKNKNNPADLSDRLKSQGVFVRGLRPGKATENYFNHLINKLSFIGAGYLIIVCLLPEFLIGYFSVPFYFGGTTLLIIVTVALDWQKQIASHFENKEYKLIKKDLFKDFKGRGV